MNHANLAMLEQVALILTSKALGVQSFSFGLARRQSKAKALDSNNKSK